MRLRTTLIVSVVTLLIIGLGIFWLSRQFAPGAPSPLARPICEVTTSSGTVGLDDTQMANAATIAAVGLRRKLPDQAIVVALATALQESKLENLDGGDRDSVGLFQQRPSQGWGRPDQLQDPRYASTKFYNALLKIKNWQQLRVTEAAQRVQRSAYPEAYDKWADEAVVLAQALSGQATSAVSCVRVGDPVLRGSAATAALSSALKLDWLTVATTVSGALGLSVIAADDQTGWQYAHWIVAHSSTSGVATVRFGTKQWSADDGGWHDVDPAGTADQVIAEVYQGS